MIPGAAYFTALQPNGLRAPTPYETRGSASTRFHLENDHGVDWLVGANGRRLFSFGVCCIDQGATPNTDDRKNPPYGAYRYYLSPDEWANDTLGRLANWGFNTVGAWSDNAHLLAPKRPDLLFTPILHIGSSAGAPWRDMWDPKVVETMDAVARDQIRAFQRDPRIVGYFSDNEMGWWNGAMWDWAFKAGTASRRQVVNLLQKTYHGSWVALNRDFDPEGAHSLAELTKQGHLFLRPGGDGIRTVHAWMEVVSDRYYSLCRQIIKRYDSGALYLGDRYISNFYPEVARSAGRYCDVVSTNVNADSDDGAFARFYLPALHAAARRPLMITEYYVAAKENRSGDGNNSSGFPVVATQAVRARVFTRETSTFAQTPYVVGAHWFQYYDEPGKGRGDGENYDMGLVDVQNRPYDEVIEAARLARPERTHRVTAPPKTDARDGVPIVPAKSLKDIGWWLNHGALMPPQGSPTRGDLYVARQDDAIYGAVYWNEDRFAEAFYRGGKVPASEEASLTFRFAGQADVSATIRLTDEGAHRSPWLIASKWGVRSWAIFRIMQAPEKPNSLPRFVANLTTRGRAYEVAWSGTYPLEKNP